MSKHSLLIDKFLNKTISSEERDVLKKWVTENEENKAFFKTCIKDSDQEILHDFEWDVAYQKFLKTRKANTNPLRIVKTVFKYAALLVVLLSIGFLVKNEINNEATIGTQEIVDAEIIEGEDIVVKLIDGSVKVLNPEGNETIRDSQGNVIANKGGNVLSFDKQNKIANTKTVLNEIYVPYGQTFTLKLSDETRVTLNSGSKLVFPQVFLETDTSRTVYLEGEAFFDVSKSKNQPFIVNTNEIDVKVYGTKFNVSSYKTDSFVATTLVEGSVSVYESEKSENELLITPSFQAKYIKGDHNFTNIKVDTDIYTAWMQNRLVIDNLEFSDILIKLERKYHVTFINNANNLNKETFKGEFKDESIESVLNTIALSTPFNFEVNEHVITITE